MDRPNVLMIMTDQHHASCVGYRGHPDVRTPNIDRLAEGGVRFDDAFTVHGTCVPSRVSYLTGQYPHTTGVFGSDRKAVPASLLSLAAYLRNFGYTTGLVGKKHLPHWATDGFEYERVCYHSDAPTRENHYYNYLKRLGLHAAYDGLGDIEKFCLGDEVIPVEHSLETWTGDEALRYLDEAGDKPFFLQVSFERPHPPLTVPPGCPFTYDPSSLTLPENREEVESAFFFDRNVELLWTSSHHGEDTLRLALAKYYALISLIDHNIGRIIERLEARGLRERTIVVFCADHGDFAGEYSRMAKGFPYDALHRIPFVWNWPGRLREGKVVEGFAENVDFFPTICGLLGARTPPTVQGQDLTPVVTGDAAPERDAVFYESIGVKTVRTKTHKLNYAFTGEGEVGELYDLGRDPHEYHNVYNDPAHREVRETLERRLLDWWIATQQPANFAASSESCPDSRWFREV